MAGPSLTYKVGTKIRSMVRFGMFEMEHWAKPSSMPLENALSDRERKLNRLLVGYPRNHNYSICRGELHPSFKLFERLRLVSSFYPAKMESFLDIGCCRGFYVLDTAMRHGCRIAAGIDVHEPFISISRKVKQHLQAENADFYLASLDTVAGNPESYGGPFQTVLLLGAYHYLFWGSHLCPTAYLSHREIFARLAKVCAGVLLFSARLEVDRLPHYIREDCASRKAAGVYSAKHCLESAAEFFKVHHAGYLGTYPLFVMYKRRTQKSFQID